MGTVTNKNSDEVDEMTIGIVSDSLLHGDQQLVSNSDIFGTVTEENNSEENDEMGTAVSESEPPHGDQPLTSYPYSDSNRKLYNSMQEPFLDEDFDEKIALVLVSK